MYHFEIYSTKGSCVRAGFAEKLDYICIKIYEAVEMLPYLDDDFYPVEASSWAELNTGNTKEDPAVFELGEYYTLYFWED